jgi:small-conductance mechanosensitive channel
MAVEKGLAAARVDDLGALIDALTRSSALIEFAALAACLGLAWLIVRAARGRRHRPTSVWFGERIVDGVLFPVLALALALLARWLLAKTQVVAVLQIAVPILASLLIIRVAVRVLRVAFPQSQLVRVVERTFSWVVWVALVLWITGLLPLVLAEMDGIHWKLGGADVSLRNLLEAALSAVVVLVGALWLSAAIETRLLAGANGNLSLRKIAANAVRGILLMVGLLLALGAAGIPIGALGVLGGAVGVGIGLGLQKLAANYVSGFVILAERSLRIGDTVKVDGFEGRISDIHTRYTVIRALNGRESIVPNEMLITQRVENSSLADPKVSLNTSVQIAYGSDLDTLMPRLTNAVSSVPRVIGDPTPTVQLNGFGADGLDLQIGFWIRDPENGQGNVRSDVNLAILRTLTEAGVEIPYPQRVVRNPDQASRA